ncbi:DUF3027 domain-containing protein [Bifidobacterium magnum]|uniref:DUF3027 domain-containing protein n=1 Tax=Bifidobacterium magnum TaxID=1692 RepID=A0A087BCR4_9BIFI|nr:DUF3027 domain-containing protein [Bifidobacterium magnum]KFI68814.1 hypothetical protein BMAGN_0687 [Bifidobacterium magnum]
MALGDVDPRAIARAVAIEMAADPQEVGEFAGVQELDNQVTDFRFVSLKRGYEGWQWSVTMFHDEDADRWTVDESTLAPTDEALLAPKWIPWKDRLEPSDLSVTDALGTDPDDKRLEPGVDGEQKTDDEDRADAQETEQIVQEFDLSRRHVLSPLGRSQTAKRWYDGPHGPKSLSTRAADGNTCETCGFFIPLQGELNSMFGVCANRWSPDDGRVVSLDHGCGEHSEIEPPEPSHIWIQTKPAYDDLHIDIVAQRAREERSDVELMESYENQEEQQAQDTGIETVDVPESETLREAEMAHAEQEAAIEQAEQPAVETVQESEPETDAQPAED